MAVKTSKKTGNKKKRPKKRSSANKFIDVDADKKITAVDIRQQKITILMRKNKFKFIHKKTELDEILGLFSKYDVDAFPVIDSKNKIVGEITTSHIMSFAISPQRLEEHDVMGSLGTRLQHIYGRKVDDVMNKHELTLEKTDTIENAAYLMWKNNVMALPVINKESSKFLGIVFQKDIIGFIKKYKKELVK